MDRNSDFNQAIETSELDLLYQPIVDLESGDVVGMEALVRWARPTRGTAPSETLPYTEEDAGANLALGRRMLHEACSQLREWQTELPEKHALEMRVELSAQQLAHQDLVPDVRDACAHAGLDPAKLTLGISESVLMWDTDLSLHRLNELNALGCKVAVADFGTGYSSLGYVKRFPIAILEIDRTFVAELDNGNATPILESIVKLAQATGLKTQAGGVVDGAQRSALSELGVDFGQGALFSPPVHRDDARNLLAAGVSLAGTSVRGAEEGPPPARELVPTRIDVVSETGLPELARSLEPLMGIARTMMEAGVLSEKDADRVDQALKSLEWELWRSPDQPSALVVSVYAAKLFQVVGPSLPPVVGSVEQQAVDQAARSMVDHAARLDTGDPIEASTEAAAAAEAMTDVVEALAGTGTLGDNSGAGAAQDENALSDLRRRTAATRVYGALGWWFPIGSAATTGALGGAGATQTLFLGTSPVWAAVLGAVAGLLGHTFRSRGK